MQKYQTPSRPSTISWHLTTGLQQAKKTCRHVGLVQQHTVRRCLADAHGRREWLGIFASHGAHGCKALETGSAGPGTQDKSEVNVEEFAVLGDLKLWAMSVTEHW